MSTSDGKPSTTTDDDVNFAGVVLSLTGVGVLVSRRKKRN